MRSLYVDRGGQPILSEGGHYVDDTTPLEDRWGGWYVTGKLNGQQHLGNLIIRDRDAPKPWRDDPSHDVTELHNQISVENYLTPHSDAVALMDRLASQRRRMSHDGGVRVLWFDGCTPTFQRAAPIAVCEPVGPPQAGDNEHPATAIDPDTATSPGSGAHLATTTRRGGRKGRRQLPTAGARGLR